MLFVKNMVFLDGAIATLAPDLDLFAEIAEHLASTSPPATATASPPTSASTRAAIELDLTGVKASFGVDDDTERLTHRELQERRETIRRNLTTAAARRRR